MFYLWVIDYDHLKWNLPELIEALLDLRQHINRLHHPNLADFDYLAPLLNLFRGHIRSFEVIWGQNRFNQVQSGRSIADHFRLKSSCMRSKWCERGQIRSFLKWVIVSESDRTYGSTWFWLVDIKSSQIMNLIQFWNDQNSINSRSVFLSVFWMTHSVNDSSHMTNMIWLIPNEIKPVPDSSLIPSSKTSFSSK